MTAFGRCFAVLARWPYELQSRHPVAEDVRSTSLHLISEPSRVLQRR